MKIFHGTSIESMLSIQKNGFSCDEQHWACSNKKKIYFYYEKNIPIAEVRALRDAKITAAWQNSQYNALGIIKAELPKELKEYFYNDKNKLKEQQSIQINKTILNTLIREHALNFEYITVDREYTKYERFRYLYETLIHKEEKEQAMREGISYFEKLSYLNQ